MWCCKRSWRSRLNHLSGVLQNSKSGPLSKQFFLLALATGARCSELHALSRHSRDLVFSEKGVSLRTKPHLVSSPNSPTESPRDVMTSPLEPSVLTLHRNTLVEDRCGSSCEICFKNGLRGLLKRILKRDNNIRLRVHGGEMF